MFRLSFLLVLLAGCSYGMLYGQENVNSRAGFIYDFTRGKYIEWPEKKGEFKIYVVGDSALFEAVKRKAGKKSLFRKNRVSVLFSQQIPGPGDINMGLVYLHASSGDDIDLLHTRFNGKPVLLVGENYPFHSVMINFITVKNKLTFEYNREMIEKAGLKALPDLSSLAASSEVEWNELLVEAEKRVEAEAQKRKKEINAANHALNKLNQELSNQQKINASTSDTLLLTRDQLDKRTRELVEKETRLVKSNADLVRHRQLMIFLVVAIALALGIIFFVYRNFVINRRAKEQLTDINKDLKKSKDDLFRQKQLVDEKQTEITDSINYALRIQRSLLPPVEAFQKLIPDHFIFYQPRDIVSGDFYWIEEVGDEILFGVIDCTGHGVPGALMSVVGMNILNQLVRERKITDPGLVLNALDKGVYDALHQYADDSAKDGMDLAICRWNRKTREFAFAGAMNPCWIVSAAGDEAHLSEHKGMLKSIGIAYGSIGGYSTQKISLEKGDCVYLFSDGFSDQFGGPNGKKFKTSRFRELFLEMSNMDMSAQSHHLRQTFNTWKSDYDQIDDICVMGVRIG